MLWSAAEAEDRLDDDLEKFPAAKVNLWGASTRIDFDTLSFTNGKLVEAATLFGDVSGFTAYIDSKYSDEDKRQALREFHAIRQEMAEVVKKDFDGVRVQFQGDRVQGLFHLPENDPDSFSQEVVSAGVGLQSSFEQVLKVVLPAIADLGLAVGISQGTTIATKLGERGHRDRICLGAEVLRAEANEERVGKFEIGISEQRPQPPSRRDRRAVRLAGSQELLRGQRSRPEQARPSPGQQGVPGEPAGLRQAGSERRGDRHPARSGPAGAAVSAVERMTRYGSLVGRSGLSAAGA